MIRAKVAHVWKIFRIDGVCVTLLSCFPAPDMTRVLRVASCLIVSIAGTHLTPEPLQAQSMMDQMILQRCSAAMQSDFDKAGQTPAPGLIQSTCACVAKQINATHNIDLAKTLCTQQPN
jgi:hypothetical protein